VEFPGWATRLWVASLVLICGLAACSAVAPLATSANQGPSAFMGVRFGLTLAQTQQLHPTGDPETSPYGADAYRLADVSVGDAKYDSVVYEFTNNHGMQMVIAQFLAGSGDLILDDLRKTLGAPDTSSDTDSTDGPSLIWHTASGVNVQFDGPKRQLILLGPYGKSLEGDINLRNQLRDY
jgi:hypothetical protein